MRRTCVRGSLVRELSGVACLFLGTAAFAGGAAENALLLVDPSDADSLYVANYYRDARNIPDSNILYFPPDAATFSQFRSTNLPALFGHLEEARIDDHIDFIVVMPGASFFMTATGLVPDTCVAVRRFSTTGGYTLANQASAIASGDLYSLEPFKYYATTNAALSFSAAVPWYGGAPSSASYAESYFLAAMLGYTGARGNTIAEIIDMIDRSVAVDGTQPAGRFYYMQTTDNARSAPRHGAYTAAVSAIAGNGGSAQKISAVLPSGRHDCLGIMTGWANPAIDTTTMTIQPGAFCDHMTSYAGTFDNNSQVKMSRWIANGASGSWGAVEEPCNWASKFPHARMHVFYQQGLTLIEAVYRSVGAYPFQGLLIGDPLTRPHAAIPTVTLSGVPSGAVSGVRNLTPTANANGGAAVSDITLLIDGVTHSTVSPGGRFSVNTALLNDGWHELRVLAAAGDDVAATGHWVGGMTTNNDDRSITFSVSPSSGNLGTSVSFTAAAAGATQLRVLHNGRIVASGNGASITLSSYGSVLGGGPVRLQAEAYYSDGSLSRSAPRDINVLNSGADTTPATPIAFSYTMLRPASGVTVPIELPASFAGPIGNLTFQITTPPTRGDIDHSRGGPVVLYTPSGTYCGNETIRFVAKNGSATSNTATITIRGPGGACRGDMNCDGEATAADVGGFILALIDQAGYAASFPDCDPENADANADGLIAMTDIAPFVEMIAK